MQISLKYRAAIPDDASACVELRGLTRENAVSVTRLAELGITTDSWSDSIRSGSLSGVVCLRLGRIIGYCFGDRDSGEIVVLALLPDYERKGIGRELLSQVMADLYSSGSRRFFLGCTSDPSSRSHGFYRHLGWRTTNEFDGNGDEILEYYPAANGAT